MVLAARAVVALAVGWLLYLGSCWLVLADPAMGGGFEVDWQLMSCDPFAFPGRLPHRILAPLLAWLLGQGGEHWHGFTEALHIVMLASVCFTAQHLGARLLDAVLVTAAIAFTAPVQMYKLHWNGYTDPICFSLFLWAIVAAKNPYVFWSLFFVNLTNHELAGFLVPWLWYLRRRQDPRWRLDLVLLGAACALYVGSYLGVKANAPQQLVRADAEVPVGERAPLGTRERHALAHAIQHDEVVAGALHLGELQPHRGILAHPSRASGAGTGSARPAGAS